MQSGKEKNHGEEKGVKTSRTTRYKDRFTVLRDKYEHVIMEQQNHRRDLESANAKIKKMQEEIDLLLEALMPTTPPAPSTVYLDSRSSEQDISYSRSQGMQDDLEEERDRANYLVSRDHPMNHGNLRSTQSQANGRINGNLTNGTRHHSVEVQEPESALNPNYLPRESHGRIPIS
ncbi:hypothetical protein F5890DRAFT_1524173 [Lentinula detonsa]|uniref:Uncharacterized protein n=1 Tax=Lentinula detonsa TaxID=2804962 RepID=A0AA38UQY6_9AGAR|nr:hypothetical protein F5890DRAFT_1524173 [Lentinula detonsa]